MVEILPGRYRHYKGNETSVRRRARPLGRVLALVPLSEQAWINAYGEGRS